MKFIHCMGLTFVVFVALYGGWLLSQTMLDKQLARFDGPPPSEPAPIKPRQPRRVPVTINPSHRQDIEPVFGQTKPRSVVLSHPTSTPSHSDRKELARQGTHGFALTQLDLSFEVDLPDTGFIRLLKQQGCEIVAFKVEQNVITDAFLPGDGELLRRATGPLASYRVDNYRAEHPVGKQFWVRWRDMDSPIGRQAGWALTEHGLPVSEYHIYLVLGDQLSQVIQQRLLDEARRADLDMTGIGYAKVVLRNNGQKFLADVLRVEQLPVAGQTGSETRSTASSAPLDASAASVPAVTPEQKRPIEGRQVCQVKLDL